MSVYMPAQTEQDGGWKCVTMRASQGCHPKGLDAVARPSNKLLGVRTLMIESTLCFLQSDTYLASWTLYNRRWLLTEE